jgi:hypothetical protein
MVEVNKRLKADTGLQRAFGRTGCFEQSVVQYTLDACTAENVTQMHQAMEAIFRRHGQTYRHDYQLNWPVLDTDMTGRVAERLSSPVKVTSPSNATGVAAKKGTSSAPGMKKLWWNGSMTEKLS